MLLPITTVYCIRPLRERAQVKVMALRTRLADPRYAIKAKETLMNNPETQNEIRMDASNLYREDVFTDNAVGTLRRLTPVTAAGEPDPERQEQYLGSTQVLTTAGPLPLSFEIPANSLDEAAQAFGDAAKAAFESTMEELKEMQRQQASSIVVPKGGMDPMGGGGMGGGGIQIP
jgi:hypothetical protein